jgi:hypothetical protein
MQQGTEDTGPGSFQEQNDMAVHGLYHKEAVAMVTQGGQDRYKRPQGRWRRGCGQSQSQHSPGLRLVGLKMQARVYWDSGPRLGWGGGPQGKSQWKKVGAGQSRWWGLWGTHGEAWTCWVRFEQAGPGRWDALALFPGRHFTCTQVSPREGE